MRQFRDSISAICIAAAWSDGQLSDFEKQALDRIHVQLDYSRSEIMDIIGNAASNGPSQDSVDIPYDPEAQLEFMRLALAVCLSDGSINNHEINFLSKLANFLSISREKLDELKQHAEGLLNPKDAREVATTPERIQALLPEQMIKLGDESEAEQSGPTRETYDPANCTRKPLSELLFEGEDYGGELSLL